MRSAEATGFGLGRILLLTRGLHGKDFAQSPNYLGELCMNVSTALLSFLRLSPNFSLLASDGRHDSLSLSLIPNQANEFRLLLHSSGHPHLLLLVLLSFSLVLPG